MNDRSQTSNKRLATIREEVHAQKFHGAVTAKRRYTGDIYADRIWMLDEIERLMAALERYGRHAHPNCHDLTLKEDSSFGPRNGCLCGLDAVLSGDSSAPEKPIPADKLPRLEFGPFCGCCTRNKITLGLPPETQYSPFGNSPVLETNETVQRFSAEGMVTKEAIGHFVLASDYDDLCEENRALRNLANNLRPGPISQALQDSPDYSGQTIERLRAALEKIAEFDCRPYEHVGELKCWSCYANDALSDDSQSCTCRKLPEPTSDDCPIHGQSQVEMNEKTVQTFEVWSVSTSGVEIATQRKGMRPTDMERYQPKIGDVFVRWSDYAAKQAKIDALMLEFCPSEMSAEQRAEWAKNQSPAPERSIVEDFARSPRRVTDETKSNEDSFEAGWRAAANWADRDDLAADIGSPAYLKERARSLAEGANTAGRQQPSKLHDAGSSPAGHAKHEYVDCPQGTGCPDCYGWEPDTRPLCDVELQGIEEERAQKTSAPALPCVYRSGCRSPDNCKAAGYCTENGKRTEVTHGKDCQCGLCKYAHDL